MPRVELVAIVPEEIEDAEIVEPENLPAVIEPRVLSTRARRISAAYEPVAPPPLRPIIALG